MGAGGKPPSLDQFVEMQPAGRRAARWFLTPWPPFMGKQPPPTLILTSGKEAESGVGIASSSSSAPASCLLPGTQLHPDLKPAASSKPRRGVFPLSSPPFL